jgi:hypothetical protein
LKLFRNIEIKQLQIKKKKMRCNFLKEQAQNNKTNNNNYNNNNNMMKQELCKKKMKKIEIVAS